MAKIQPLKPFLLVLYGFPGSGKTYFGRQFADSVNAAHLQADRIRSQLYQNPRYDKDENRVVTQIMNYMCEEFLAAGVSVIYDNSTYRSAQRRMLYDVAFKNHAQHLVVWLQLDTDTAFYRNIKRDRRKADDKYSGQWDRTTFESLISGMQNPTHNEDFIVISGKHVYPMQQSAVLSKLSNLGLLSSNDSSEKVIKPGMVNLIPNTPGRVDLTRRNIAIR